MLASHFFSVQREIGLLLACLLDLGWTLLPTFSRQMYSSLSILPRPADQVIHQHTWSKVRRVTGLPLHGEENDSSMPPCGQVRHELSAWSGPLLKSVGSLRRWSWGAEGGGKHFSILKCITWGGEWSLSKWPYLQGCSSSLHKWAFLPKEKCKLPFFQELSSRSFQGISLSNSSFLAYLFIAHIWLKRIIFSGLSLSPKVTFHRLDLINECWLEDER